jgi:hypothetical protein
MRLRRSFSGRTGWIGFDMTITFDLYAIIPALKERADRFNEIADRFNEIMDNFVGKFESNYPRAHVDSCKIGEMKFGEMKLSNVSEKATLDDIEKIREIWEGEYRKKLPTYDIKVKWSGNIEK